MQELIFKDSEPFELGITFIGEMELNNEDLCNSCYFECMITLEFEPLTITTFN